MAAVMAAAGVQGGEGGGEGLGWVGGRVLPAME